MSLVFLPAVRRISQHFYTGYMARPVSNYSYIYICGRYRRSEVEGAPHYSNNFVRYGVGVGYRGHMSLDFSK